MTKRLPCRPYAQSLGANSLANHRDSVGARLAHDQSFDKARAWAMESVTGDDRRVRFLSELAMFCDAYGRTSEAQECYLAALEESDRTHRSFFATLSAALALALTTLDHDFAEALLRRLPEGAAAKIMLRVADDKRREPYSLPVDVELPIAEDLAAAILLIYLSAGRGNITLRPKGALFDQLEGYFMAVTTAASCDGTPPQLSLSLEEITLTVLAQLALRAKRQKRHAELTSTSRQVENVLQEFGRPIEVYPKPLIEILRRTGAIDRSRGAKVAPHSPSWGPDGAS